MKKAKKAATIDVSQGWEYKQDLRAAKRAGTPTYAFNPGEEVNYGCVTHTTVLKSLENGLLYEVNKRVEKEKKHYDETVEVVVSESTAVVPWFRLRPLSSYLGKTDFERNEDVRLYYANTTIESLIHRCLSSGIDMNPEYQRGNVWTEEEKQAFLNSIFMHAEIGRFVIRSRECDANVDFDKFLYEIVDGKQRLSTIIDFYLNRLAYKGAYYNELSAKDRRCFLNTNISLADMDNATKEDALRVFLMVNQSGHPMDPAVLSNAKKLLEKRNKK